jgi:hypothetical protein
MNMGSWSAVVESIGDACPIPDWWGGGFIER